MINRRLLGMIQKECYFMIYIFGLKIITLIINIWMIITVSDFIYHFVEHKHFSSMDLFILLMIILIRTLIILFSKRVSIILSTKVKEKLRLIIFDRVYSYGMKCSSAVKLSDLVSLSVNAVENLEVYFSAFLPQLAYALIGPVILSMVLFRIQWTIGLGLLLLIPIIPIAIALVQKLAKKVNTTYWASYLDLSDMFMDFLSGLTSLLLFGADERYNKKMNAVARGFRINTMKVLTMQLNNLTALDLVAYIGAGFGVFLSLYYYSLGAYTLKEAIIVILISAEFFLPLRLLGSLFHVAMNGMGAIKFLFDIIDKDIKDRGEESIPSEGVQVLLKDVIFSYVENRPILKGINMELNQGNLIYIVGKSGCGKSTIASLVMNRIEPASGFIAYNGVVKAKEKDILNLITLVTNNSYLFKGSLRDNLLMGKVGASDEEMWEVLEKLSLKDYFLQEHGLDSLIEDRAENFSGGQRQRIVIARALLKDSGAYIFDEATSNIDAESEDIIMKNLQEIKKDKLIVIISHRLKYTKDSDYIYYMEDGKVQEEGDFKSLCNKEGSFKKLYDKQMAMENWGLRNEENK